MIIRLFFNFTFVFLLLMAGGASEAQLLDSQQDQGDNVLPQRIDKKTRSEISDRAERLMLLGDYQRATDLLEIAYEKNPDDFNIKTMLVTCYEQTKNFDKMVWLLRERLAAESPGYQLLRSLGRAYVLKGSPDSAETFFYDAVNSVRDNERAYASVAEIFHSMGHYRLESEFIDSSRILTGNPSLLADRMGDALAAQRRFGEATLEYLAYMEKDTLTEKIATEKLVALMRYPESADTVMALLSDQIKTRAENKSLLNIYGHLLLEQGRYDEAFKFHLSRDSLEASQGGSIINFIQSCNVRGAFEYAIRAGEHFLEHNPESSLRNRAIFDMANALIETGRYNDALTAYLSIANDLIRPVHRAESKLRIGILYKDHLLDFEKAKAYLHEVTKSVPGGRFDIDARFALADLAVKEGRLDTAITFYEYLQQHELPDKIMEQLEYSLAEIFLFKEDYKEAITRFRQIISRYPRGFYVNDAIQYSLIISETLEGAPKQIDLFASAEYFRYTGQNDSLEYYLTKICRVGIPSLAPVSHLRLAQLYYNQSHYDEAVESIDSLVQLYEGSYFLPYGLKLKADIYLQAPGTRDEALDLYRNLLESYATYPFAAEVRDIIRQETPTGQI